jgi:peptidoglycan hydrolase-like protein with peptidoglycan-binding domain
MNRLIAVAGTALIVAGCAQNPTTPVSAAAPAPSVQPPSVQAPAPSAAVRDAQARLRTLGFYNGPVDGLAGPETARAVEAFQRSRGLDPTGDLSSATVAEMRRDAAAPRSAAAAPSEREAAIPIGNQTAVRTVQNRLKQLGFYDGPADGVWGVGTQTAVERYQREKRLPGTGELTARTVSAMGLDPATFKETQTANVAAPLDPAVVRGLQQKLRRLGFYSGPVDGVWGERSRVAVERFQRSRGLDPSGELTPTTIAALGLDPNNLTQSARVR